jgi:hypothetical protein
MQRACLACADLPQSQRCSADRGVSITGESTKELMFGGALAGARSTHSSAAIRSSRKVTCGLADCRTWRFRGPRRAGYPDVSFVEPAGCVDVSVEWLVVGGAAVRGEWENVVQIGRWTCGARRAPEPSQWKVPPSHLARRPLLSLALDDTTAARSRARLRHRAFVTRSGDWARNPRRGCSPRAGHAPIPVDVERTVRWPGEGSGSHAAVGRRGCSRSGESCG